MRGAFLELAETEPTVEGFEARALDLLLREVPADGAFFGVAGETPTVVARGLDPESLARMQHHSPRYEREVLPIKQAALEARGVAVDTAVLGESTVRKARYFREVVARLNGRHSLFACLSWRGTPRGSFVLGRTGTSFSRDEVQRLEALLPELCAARAVYGWPWLENPLPESRPRRWPAPWRRAAEVIATLDSEQGRLCVRDRDGFRELVIDDTRRELVWTRAELARPSRSGWPYIELLHVAAAVAAQRRRALFIGLGGGVAVRQFARTYPGLAIDVVERDARVVELAQRWFGLSELPGVKLHLGDGAEFLAASAPAALDVVVVDAYGADFAEAFGRRPFFAAAHRAMTPGGALALNLIGTLDGTGLVPAVLSAASRELTEPRVIPVVDPEQPHDASAARNVVVVWSNRRA